ncbi:unnamed protein product [Sphagnum jensenii]|uniref:Transposase n=1 Tax=Sphagnum jensenii TaxID=128206 RepID=A0ABP0VGK8_9BRYO
MMSTKGHHTHNIVDAFGPTERRCIVKCRALDLIPVKDPAFYACPTCNGPVGKRDKPSEKLGYTFRCKAKGCGKTLSPLANTIFERSKLPLLTILTAVYWFVNEVTRAQASSFLKVSEPSITALWKKLRRACGQLGSWNQIGGENLILNVTKLTCFENTTEGGSCGGGQVDIRCFLSGDTRVFFHFCPQQAERDHLTSYGSSDQGRINCNYGLRGILPRSPGGRISGSFDHKPLCHSREQICSSSTCSEVGRVVEVHTNNIEVQWKLLKARIDSFHNDDIVEGYLEKAQYFRNILDKMRREARFGQFLKDLARIYPGPPRALTSDPDETMIYFSDSESE